MVGARGQLQLAKQAYVAGHEFLAVLVGVAEHPELLVLDGHLAHIVRVCQRDQKVVRGPCRQRSQVGHEVFSCSAFSL